MKRRLHRAYEQMIMSDSCSRRIEQKIIQQLQARQEGRYIKEVHPTRIRRKGWAAALAAVCMVLIVSAGGTVLLLNGMEHVIHAPADATDTIPEVVAGDYSLVTDIPAEAVEVFASAIRQNILDGDWAAFSEKVHYPITVLDKRIGAGGLIGLTIRNKVQDSFLEQIEKENCNQMFCNWQGICMADGRIWINEVEGELKITAINDMFRDLVDSADFQFLEMADGNVAIVGYSGTAEELTLPIGYNQGAVTRIGNGTPVIWDGETLRILWIPDSITAIGERAFADCPTLKSVFFRGDAPPEAEGVFEGSENVTVYYRPDSKGWGDTWCGRKTLQYDEGHVSLGVAEVSVDPEEAYQALYDILKEKKGFFCEDSTSAMTITQYCERRSKEAETEVTIPYFTMADMDWDGIKELILWVDLEGDDREDYLILRYDPYDSAEGGMVYTFLEPQQKITDLKKDGSFYWRGGGGQGETWLALDGSTGQCFVNSSSQREGVPVEWHAYPCVRPELVLASYEYAGTGQTRLPGNPYFTFETLIRREAGNNWESHKEQMTRWGMVCLEDEGTVTVFDPDAPGCCLFGTLTNENGFLQFADVGYYISNEYGERQAEVRELLSDTPTYVAGTHLEQLDSHGREVASVEDVLDYLSTVQSADPHVSERTVEHVALRKTLNAFVDGCVAKDSEGLVQYLTKDFSGAIPDVLAGMKVQIISYDNFPDGYVEDGGHLEVSLALAEVENPPEVYRLSLTVIKTEEGWKIKSCDWSE